MDNLGAGVDQGPVQADGMDRIADMLDGTDAAVGYADGVNALALAETAAKSIITGKPVRP